MNGSWLPLTDYSTKYRVSVSTLRRRIKSEDVKFKLSDGKYFVFDEPLSGLDIDESDPRQQSIDTHELRTSDLGTHRPSQVSTAQESEVMMQHMAEETKKVLLQTQQLTEKFKAIEKYKTMKEEPILTAANRLLGELKKAYSQILQEKEEQIFQLKEEVTDLKTLVRVLEGENERLNIKSKNPSYYKDGF